MYVSVVPADYALATLLPLHTYFGKYESVWLELMGSLCACVASCGLPLWDLPSRIMWELVMHEL